MKVYAYINNKVILWAREKVNLSRQDVVNKLNRKTVDVELLKLWEEGLEYPTIAQAKELAKLYGLNLTLLYFTDIPKNITPKIKDLRSINYKLSREAIFLMRDINSKQKWAKEYLVSKNSKELGFVGSVSIGDVDKAVDIIKNNLGIELNTNKDANHNIKEIVSVLESKGIFVSFGSSYNNHSANRVRVEEIRGFAIADKIAPFIFINSLDTVNAKLFTLIHELTHILIGESVLSDVYSLEEQKNEIEIFCNKVAGEFLIPTDSFKNIWNTLSGLSSKEKIDSIAKDYPVSKSAILLKSKLLEFVKYDEYKTLYIGIKKDYTDYLESNKNKKHKKEYAPPYYKDMVKLNTRNYSGLVFEAYSNNEIGVRDVASLLGVGYENINNYREKLYV